MLRTHLGSALALAAAVSHSGCERLWQGNTRPDPQNCLLDSSICSAQQRCNLLTEICEPLPPAPDMAMTMGPDMAGPLPAPPSQIFPHGPATAAPSGGTTSQLAFARPASFQLAAIGNARFYYTLDGSPPMPGGATTQVGDSVLGPLLLGGTTTVRWFADYGTGYVREALNDFSFTLLSTTPVDFDAVPEAATFDQSGGPVVVAMPGADLSGRANFRGWASSASGVCASCPLQYVVTAETQGAVGCLAGVEANGPYPGATSTVNFSFKAPLLPGRYRLYAGMAYQASCDGTSPSGPDIGLFVVK